MFNQEKKTGHLWSRQNDVTCWNGICWTLFPLRLTNGCHFAVGLFATRCDTDHNSCLQNDITQSKMVFYRIGPYTMTEFGLTGPKQAINEFPAMTLVIFKQAYIEISRSPTLGGGECKGDGKAKGCFTYLLNPSMSVPPVEE